MENDNAIRSLWRFFDGSVSVSASMLLSILISACPCDGLPLLGYLNWLTKQEDGIIIVATLLLFPTTAGLYGVFAMIFAAKETIERRAMKQGRRMGRKEGREEGREEGRVEGRAEGRAEGREAGITEGEQAGRRAERARIAKMLAEQGVTLSPEIARSLADDAE